MQVSTNRIQQLAQQSAQAAALLRALANEQRLLILCHLSAAEELSVSALGERLELSQSALSQHLARLREDGIVAFRREAQTLFYHIADQKAAQLLGLLHDLYCPEL
ncbi:metalloregulator ArsR/SmtB family transcription factor [Sphingomonas sp.]|uniref:ArsR/SmtB family transcription factor n=1 Tax=Sphingomonas sp. TaxID=28214 RepID=UPI0025E4A906|nr:metalloregulator ArsR/SmtB family transcription factor [Sphingomonas sp.]